MQKVWCIVYMRVVHTALCKALQGRPHVLPQAVYINP
jgi:hypothetical protein